ARDPGCRLARRGPLQHVANVAVLVLHRSDQVRVAGTREVNLGDIVCHRPRAHPLLPVGVIAVLHLNDDGTAERVAVADAAGDLGGVSLDLHPSPPAVAELAAREVRVQILGAHLQAGRQTLEYAGQAGSVRLAGGSETERHAPSLYLACSGSADLSARSVGAVWPPPGARRRWAVGGRRH